MRTEQPHPKALDSNPEPSTLRRRPRDREPASYCALSCKSLSGTSMLSLGNCQEPHCQKCEDDEYQDKFTKESKCVRQPYCDPSKSGATTLDACPAVF